MQHQIKKIWLAQTAATSVVQTLFVRVLLMVLSLASAVVAARTLGPFGRGEQSAMALWPYLISGLATFGVAPALTYFTSRDRSAEGGLLLSASVLSIITGIASGAIGCFIVPHVMTKYPAPIVHGAQILMFFSPVLLLSYVLRANFEARGDFRRSNMSRLWPPFFTLVGLLVLWATHTLTPFYATLALFVPAAVQAVWLCVRLWTRLSFDFAAFVPNAKLLLNYGIKSYVTDIMNTLSVQVDQAVVIAFLSPKSLGLYTAALTASRTLNVLQQSVNTVLFPKAAGLDAARAIDLVGRMTRISNAVSALGVTTFIIVIPFLVTFFYGKAFQAAADITRTLSVEAFLAGMASVLAQAFLSTGRPTIVAVLQFGWIAASFVFLTTLVPRYGINGAALALVIASFLRLLATLVCYPALLKHPVPALVPGRADLHYIVDKIRAVRSAS